MPLPGRRWTVRTLVMAVALVVTATAIRSQALRAPSGSASADGEWLHLGGDSGSTRYSSLTQLTPANLNTLRLAWRRPAVAHELTTAHPDSKFGNIRSTQFFSRGVLYFTNAVGLVEAVDPGTGRTIRT